MAHWLIVIAAGLFIVRLGLFVVLHLVPGGIHPVHDSVSDYAASASKVTRRLATVASWSVSAAWVALGLGVLGVAGHAGTKLGIWLVVLGVILAIMPFVPTDRTGTPTTIRGRVHLLFAVAWFAIAYATIDPLAHLLAVDSPIRSLLGILSPIAAVALAALVISLVVRPLRTRTFGISERVFILVVTVAPMPAALALATR